MENGETSRAAELRRFVADTLAAASREILAAVDRLVAELEEEAAGCRRSVSRCADTTCWKDSSPFEENLEGLENLDLTSPSGSLHQRRRNKRTKSNSFEDHEKKNQLRIRILDDPRTTVLSNSVLRRCPVHRLCCRPGLQEADFTHLLRTYFPPPTRDGAFDVLMSDRRRRLRPLKPKRLTPEEIRRSFGSSWSSRSTVHIRPKEARPPLPVSASRGEDAPLLSDGTFPVPHVLDEPAGVKIQPISSNQEVCEESGRPTGQSVPAVKGSGTDSVTENLSGTKVDQSDSEARETSEPEDTGANGGELRRDRKAERTEGKVTRRPIGVSQGPAGPASNDGTTIAGSPAGPDGVGSIKPERDVGDASCKVCRLAHVSETAPAEHVWCRHTGEPDHVCGVCGEGSESADLLKKHLENRHESHHRNEPFPGVTHVAALAREDGRHNEVAAAERHRCHVCHQEFPLKEQLKVHRRSHGNRKSHLCGVCGKSLSDYRSLSRHMMIHSEERPHACRLCGKRFKLVGTLRQHEKIHTERQRSFLCDVCCKMFLTSQQLHDHMMTHGERKPHRCAQCGRGFIKKGALTVHQRVHTGDAPYRCPHCGWAFRWKSNLAEHLRVHSGAKPFVCTICGKACARKVYLTVHMRTHNGERPYKCSVCEKVFTQGHCLKTHMRSHKGASPAP